VIAGGQLQRGQTGATPLYLINASVSEHRCLYEDSALRCKFMQREIAGDLKEMEEN